SLITTLLRDASLDPTYTIGGVLQKTQTNAALGTGDYWVTEADESDASFLFLQPQYAIVTNVDRDHLERYNGDFDALKRVFVQFLERLPFYGLAIVCWDDLHTRDVCAGLNRPYVGYGMHADAGYRITDVQAVGCQTACVIYRPHGYAPLSLTLNLAGLHNLYNATAAVALGTELGISDVVIQRSLSGFSGVGRRFELQGTLAFKKPDIKNVLLIEDYGHHPTEVQATIQAARAAWPTRRLVWVFQPHRYTRMAALMHEFATVLSQVDCLMVLDIYGAREVPIAGVTAQALMDGVCAESPLQPYHVPSYDAWLELLPHVLM
ncbi:MAG: Mur ligase family protein, partial [Pseudomonadota bacterium]